MILNIQLLANLVMYYSNQFYQINGTEFTATPLTQTTKVLILARHLYLERHISLPIVLARDVKAALDFEIAELKDEFFVFHRINTVSDGLSHITIWQVPKNVIPNGVLFAIPETYLLGLSLQLNDLIAFSCVSPQEEVLIAMTVNGVRSTSSKQVNQMLFSQAVGVTDTEIELKTPQEVLGIYKAMLLKNWPSLVTVFWVKRELKTQNIKQFCQPYLKPALVVSVLYLFITSLFVYTQHEVALASVEGQSTEIKDVLNLKTDISNLQQQLSQLDVSDEVQAPLWKLWQVLGPLYEQDVRFNFIRYAEGMIYINAESASSSKVLEYLLDNTSVVAPEFTAAVRKMKNTESYTIRFSLASSDGLAQQAAVSHDE